MTLQSQIDVATELVSASLGAPEEDEGALQQDGFGGVPPPLDEDARYGSTDDAFAPSGVAAAPWHENGHQSQRNDGMTEASRQRRWHWRMRIMQFLGLVCIVCVIVGTVVGRLVQGDRGATIDADNDESQQQPHRATSGVYETIDHFLKSKNVMQWNDGSSHAGALNNPYQKAMEWILNDDPMQLLATNATLIQRYLAVYFYFATSTQHPWTTACAPSTTNAGTAVEAKSDQEDCVYQQLATRDPELFYAKASAYKWLSSRSECDWAGVLCDEMQQIFHIDTSGMNLTGSFPEAILLLPFLDTLVVSDNQLTGTLPESLSTGKFLEEVQLDRNSFVGSIPNSWYTMRNLKHVNLGVNRLTGSIGTNVAHLTNLKQLKLYENVMTGTLPTILGSMPSLRTLLLNDNSFDGSIPSSWDNLAHLAFLRLQHNLVTGSIPTQIGQCTRLEELRLNHNRLNGTLPDELYNVTALFQLDLFDNALSGTVSTKIGQLSNLWTALRIENNKLNGTLPTELGKLKILQEFAASGNDFVGAVPRRLCSLRSSSGTAGSPGGSDKVLAVLQVDCSSDNNAGNGTATPKISCAVGCCTQCCDRDGANCVPMLE